MKIHSINDDSNSHVIDILREGITPDMLKNDSLCKNYLYDYRGSPANVFNMLARGTFRNGQFYVIEDGGFVACCGWYPYSKDTAILLSRMLVNPKRRTEYIVGKHILPLMIEQTKQYNNVWITCNDYNKSIYNWFSRSAEGKSPALFNNWPDTYKMFKPIGQHVVNGVLQYVVALER